jgi:hypothetical protein
LDVNEDNWLDVDRTTAAGSVSSALPEEPDFMRK